MIVVSIGLVLVAAALLVVGLVQTSDALFYGSIAASALAGIALVVGVRRVASAGDNRPAQTPGRPDPAAYTAGPRPVGRARVPAPSTSSPAPPAATGHGGVDPRRDGTYGDTHGAAESAGTARTGTVGAAAGGDGSTRGGESAENGPDIATPPDEPAAQVLTDVQAVRLARLAGESTFEVSVIDGRPRYHLAECMHLLGRDAERLPAAEAIELGFTPCGHCEPATALLTGVPRS